MEERGRIQGQRDPKWNGLKIDIAAGVVFRCSGWKGGQDT